MGYFAEQALDLLNPDLTIEEQLQKDFPGESIGTLRNLAGAFQFQGTTPTRRSDRSPAARRRGSCSRTCC